MSILMKDISNIKSTMRSNVHFCFFVIVLFSIKFDKYLRYIFVDLNHISYLVEPFENKKPVNKRNGVVGKIGSKIPSVPKPSDKKPETINRYLILFGY